MRKDRSGYFHAEVPGITHGDRYYYQPDSAERYPDPASSWQPEGVHGPSAVVDHHRYAWNDDRWRGAPFSSLIFYELHVGAFTPEGTFDSIIPRLDDLAGLGINALELMPVAQCPGKRNWGYDEVFLYAVQDSYGSPEGLKRLVDACHQKDIAVFLDVVYNHVGREGKILDRFGPYFSDKYHTPWGKAFNYDGALSDGVREFIVSNVVYWAEQYHIDGLRLDAVHEIFDRNAVTIWDELQTAVGQWEQRSGRRFYLIAESDLNSPRVVRPPALGGLGFQSQWMDDFHHALYVLLDPDGKKHYADFGRLEQLAKAYTEGFVHTNEWVGFRRRRHGASSAGLSGDRFIVFNQNHDIPGNRPGGERLSVLVDLPRLKLAAAAVLLSPYIPLLFMGEEYGETAPFYFFSDYGDPAITGGLQEARIKQFADFDWDGEPPDAQLESTFSASIPDWGCRSQGDKGIILDWHRRLITLRRENALLADTSKNNFRADLIEGRGLALYRRSADQSRELHCLLNFFGEELSIPVLPHWNKLLESTATTVTGNTLHLPPWGVIVYEEIKA